MYHLVFITRKTILALVVIQFICFSKLISQNTVSIGTDELNNNAVLQLVSQDNNQGFLMPQLSTSDRLAMNLTDGDIGMLVYDIDLGTFYYWHEGTWNEIGNGQGGYKSGDVTQTASQRQGFQGTWITTFPASASSHTAGQTAPRRRSSCRTRSCRTR